MKILILGGTVFLGRHLVEAALARGHEVTLFNRGVRNPDLFPELERLRGNRDGDLEALKGRRWDAVIDPSGYLPRVVRASAELLADAVEHYTFISSISVYADPSVHRLDESGALATLEDESSEEVMKHYGALKALCERAAEAAMPGRVLNVRPGLIVGPHDPTDRFTYWPVRVAAGGEVLAPGERSRLVQIIDARDLAEWIISMVERKGTGVYNATGPNRPYSMEQLLEECRSAAGSDAHFTWVDDAFLVEQQVTPWTGLPLWIPGPGGAGLMNVDVSRALAEGLRFRPLGQTIQDTLAWDRTRPADLQRRAGISREREAELLAAFRGRGR
ncbi:MAG: NAD-dependent epimerase/dehydratase family protein [Bacillota bacterium]